MSIAIIGKIQVRRDTTANWNYVNPVLPDRVWGHEENAGVPVGSKLGDGVTVWSDLPYWYGVGPATAPITVTIVANTTDNPVAVDISSLGGAIPTVLFNDTDNERVKLLPDVGLSGTTLTILLDDDGTGKCLNNGVLVVRG